MSAALVAVVPPWPKALGVALVIAVASLGATPAFAAPVWTVEPVAQPTNFQTSDGLGDDSYGIELENIGTTSSTGAITVVDRLPPGVTTSQTPQTVLNGSHEGQWSCSLGQGQTVVTCTTESQVDPVSATFGVAPTLTASNVNRLVIPVTVASGAAGTLSNSVTVSGGGALTPVTASSVNEANGDENAKFGLAFASLDVVGATGQPFTQAGGHPYAATAAIGFNRAVFASATNAALYGDYHNAPGGGRGDARTIIGELPLGLIGNPQATPRCPLPLFKGFTENITSCPRDTAVGTVLLDREQSAGPYTLFNLEPEAGHAAQFGFTFGPSIPVVLNGDVAHSDRGYVLRLTALIPQANIAGFFLTFFGDPAAAFANGAEESPFLTSPDDCGAGEEARTLQLHADSWAAPGAGDPFAPDYSDLNWRPASSILQPVEDCSALVFAPSLTVGPAGEGGTGVVDAPSGYDFNIRLPQTDVYSELATPELKTAKVTLPAGLSVSPSAAGGLETCSNEQIALASNEPGSCPLGSQLGTVKLTTPLLEEPLEGEVFLGTPECGSSGLCTEADGSEGKTFRLFIQMYSSKLGVTIKLAGTVGANPTNGQLMAEFAENPELPFNDLELHFKNGPRAPLANPQTCGAFTTVSDLEPWSAPQTPTAVSESSFAVTGCGSSLPFAPGFTAAMTSSVAAQSSALSVSFGRQDGEQDLGGVTVQTPPGLLERMEGVAKCGEAEANAGTCPAASQIGTTTVSAGPGSDPYTIAGGKVYLTGPYKSAPFGLAIAVPAEAGPFHLAGNTGRGVEVVRAAIAVNPSTAALTVASDPLPQIIDGVPIRLRTVDVEINRPGFMLNATDCSTQTIAATLTGEHPIGSGEGDKTSTVATPYAADGCGSLPFKPSFQASTSAKVSKAGGASLDVKIAQRRGEANVRGVDVQLPTILPARLRPTLNHACGEAQFAANPAGCPADAFVGTATAVTPALNVPLTGPAIFVSHGGAAFPDLDLVLQGEGVTIDLTGHTQIKKGITYSRFETVPDAPISSFELNLPEGPHSALAAPAADGSLCHRTLTKRREFVVRRKGHVVRRAGHVLHETRTVHRTVKRSLIMPIGIEGQNGTVVNQTTNIAITGCALTKGMRKPRLTKHRHDTRRHSGRKS